jgi:hypothetical protein
MEAARSARASLKGFDASILDSLDDFVPSVPTQVREVAIADLDLGMTLRDDVFNSNGLLVVAKGQDLTFQWIKRLEDLSKRGVIGHRVHVWMPQSHVA